MDGEAVGQALQLRAEGLTYAAIGAVLGVHGNTARRMVRETQKGLELAEVDWTDLPLATTAGMYWRRPRVAPTGNSARNERRSGCYRCEDLGQCKWAVRRGHAIGCESPLKRELDPTWVREKHAPRVRGAKESLGGKLAGVL